MIDKIQHNDALLAIVIRADYRKEGISFFTPGDFSQQLGYMNRKKGYVIAPHIHQIRERKVTLTQEVLVVRAGKVKVDFYTDDCRYLESTIIEKGDVILLAAGGHGFEMLEDSELIEVKQGPYDGDEDKIHFKETSR